MSYRIAAGGGNRRIGSSNYGPRTIGYDANPKGLAGRASASSARGSASLDRYKKYKKQKEEDEQVQARNPPPYPEEEGEQNSNFYIDSYADPKDRVYVGKGVPGSNGSGWILSVVLPNGKSPITATGRDAETNQTTAIFFITDVSDKTEIKLPTAPLENGMVKHDHKVRQPKTLRVSGYVKRGFTEEIEGLLEKVVFSKSLGAYLELSSPWKPYPKMYLKSYTSKASNKKYDVYDYALDLTELMLASDMKDTTDDPDLASNTDKGAVSPK